MRIAYEQKGLVPQGYTRLEYLESTGTQYIDTGYAFTSLNHTTTVRFKNITGGSETPYWVGGTHAGGTDKSGGFVRITSDATKVGCGIGGITAGSSPYRTDMPVATPKTMSLVSKDTKKFDWIVDGSYIYTDTSFTGTSVNGLNEYIFACNRENVARFFSNVTIYSYQLIDNGVLVRDFIPVKRNSDNTIGMYDLVGKKFYTNAGTGTFTAGGVIEEVEYIESRGAEYIKTDVIGTRTSGLKVYVDCQGTGEGSSSSSQIVVSGDGKGSAGEWFGCSNKNGYYSSGGYALSNVSYTTRVQTTISFGTGVSWELNGTTYSRGGNIDGTNPVYLFQATLHGTKYKSYSKMYACKIYNEGELKADLVPVKVGTEYAMFDKVNGVVYRNQDTGSFTGGNVVKHYTPRLVYTVNKGLVPAGYEQLEYLESTTRDNGIDTGVLLGNDISSRVVVDMSWSVLGTSSYAGYVFGKYVVSDERFYVSTYSQSYWTVGYVTSKSPNIKPTINTRYKIEMVSGESGASFYVNDELLGSYTGNVLSTDGLTSQLFSVRKTNGPDTSRGMLGKIYSAQFYNNGSLVRNFIPARRKSDGVLGMYDTVNGVFYTNAGSGSFTGGSVVSNYQLRFIRTPVIPND